MDRPAANDIVQVASRHLQGLRGDVLEVVDVLRPATKAGLLNLSRTVSKQTPFVGNSIEFLAVEYLNDQVEFEGLGSWRRQDPGFPDTIFDVNPDLPQMPPPGIEVKAWFPFSTEITGRFKMTETSLSDGNVSVSVLAWLPEYLLFGKPKIIDVCVVSGLSVAQARNGHYYNPPHYLVIEPEETSDRTVNLQQSNTEGYVLQAASRNAGETPAQMAERLGLTAGGYDSRPEYQARVNELRNAFAYRLDTNYAKIDRIEHRGIEDFKQQVLDTVYWGRTIRDWQRFFSSRSLSSHALVDALHDALGGHLGSELASCASRRLIP